MSPVSPSSINDYLAALRAELSGEDPALIQDALYDSEEYLRAEVAEHPEMSEAAVLERLLTTYGRPDEIAAAYRNTESTVKRALRPPVVKRPASPNPLDRFLSVYSDPHAYMSLFFMFLSLITGTLYFTFAITALSLSLGLAVLIVGFPLFIVFIHIARVISLGEGRLLEAVSGERMPRRPVHPGFRGTFWERIFATLRDPRTWSTIGYLVMMMPVGIVYFVIAVIGISVGLAMLLVPLVGVANRLGSWEQWDIVTVKISPAFLDTPVGWVFSAVLGIVILTAVLHMARLLIALHARAAKVMLVT